MNPVPADRPRVLIVDDEADIRLGLELLLRGLELHVQTFASGRDALAELARGGADLVVTDLQMPGMSGTELLAEIKARHPETEVVVLTGYGTIRTAVWCMQHGARHFLTKPFDNEEVRTLISRLARQRAAGTQIQAAAVDGPQMIAESPRMRATLALVDRVARADVAVLIEGETGTGKELIARALHARGSRSARPFQAVNCAALPDTLLEAELFGHAAGAFTGARTARSGLFAEADGGTVFLDEVASMSTAFQGKLLRVLQDRVVRPLGAAADIPVDFRLVAATNRDLEEMVRRGEFREDLFYRLRVVSIPLPPLRERKEDVPALATHFLALATAECLGPEAAPAELTPAAIAALQAHDWPGNVRELENAVRRAVVVCMDDQVLPHHLGLASSAWAAPKISSPTELEYEDGKREAVRRFQREFVARALRRTRGNVTQAAEECGLTRAALQRILKQLDMDREQFA